MAASAPPELVAAVQRDLTRLGCAPGPLDGLLGRRSRAAIRAFQRAAGLAVDGEPSALLLARLRASGDGIDVVALGGPRPAGRGGTGRKADRRLQPRAAEVLDGALPRALAITSDAALTAIVERRERGRRR